MKNHPSEVLRARRPRTSRKERQDWIKAWQASDQTQEEFARSHGLKVGTLRGWIQRQARAGDEPVRLKEIKLAEVIGPGLATPSPAWEFERRFPDGRSLAVARGT